MKKIIVGAGIVLGSFIALVIIIFVVLTAMEPIDESAIAEAVGEKMNQSTDANATTPDSILAGNQKLVDELKLIEYIRDSLQAQLKFKDNLIKGYSETIEKLNDDILATNNQNVRVKELAKTYESMKTDEMKPILANVDNETVLAIYMNMNSRTRKNILIALPGKRASVITQLLAKKREKDKHVGVENISTMSNPAPDKEKPETKSTSVGNPASPKAKPKLADDTQLANDDFNGYRVQIFCSGSSKGSANIFKSDAESKLEAPLYIEYENRQYKVRAGNFTERDAADDFCKHAVEQGFKDAWVVKAQIENIQLASP